MSGRGAQGNRALVKSRLRRKRANSAGGRRLIAMDGASGRTAWFGEFVGNEFGQPKSGRAARGVGNQGRDEHSGDYARRAHAKAPLNQEGLVATGGLEPPTPAL